MGKCTHVIGRQPVNVPAWRLSKWGFIAGFHALHLLKALLVTVNYLESIMLSHILSEILGPTDSHVFLDIQNVSRLIL